MNQQPAAPDLFGQRVFSQLDADSQTKQDFFSEKRIIIEDRDMSKE